MSKRLIDCNAFSEVGGGGGEFPTDYAKEATVQAVQSKMDTLLQPVVPCKRCYFEKNAAGTGVSLTWSDPEDLVVSGITWSTWSQTKIVKKQGSAPQSVTDGTLVVSSNVRNQYAVNGYEDIQENVDNWYYRAFTVAANGKVNTDDRSVFIRSDNVYGFCIDEAVENPYARVTYIEGNTDFEPAYMDFDNNTFHYGSWRNAWFMPKPCMLKRDGTVDYYLDPDDYTKKSDGTGDSDINDLTYDGNAMMEWPSVFYNVDQDTATGKIYVRISPIRKPGYDCFCTQTGSDTYADHFYLPIYEGYKDSNGVMRSMCVDAKPVQDTFINMYTACVQNDNGAAGEGHWTSITWADVIHMTIMTVLMFKTTNIAQRLGAVNSTTATTSAIKIGGGNQSGMFYGPRFTSENAGKTLKLFGSENWYCNNFKAFVGFHSTLTAGSSGLLTKMTYKTTDGSTVEGYLYNTGADFAKYDRQATCPTLPTSSYVINTIYATNKMFGFPKTAVDATAGYDRYYANVPGLKQQTGTNTYVMGSCPTAVNINLFRCCNRTLTNTKETSVAVCTSIAYHFN